MLSNKTTARGMRAIHINIPLKTTRKFDPAAFLASSGLGRTIVHLGNKELAFSQGEPAENVFYIQSGAGSGSA